MSTWMKKVIEAEGVTEYRPGPHLDKLEERFGGSGAVMLLLDVSGSMTGDMDAAIEGSLGFVADAEGGGYQVGAALWDTGVVDSVAPSAKTKAAVEMLKKARARGGTNVTPALTMAGNELMKIDVKDRVIAVFGDGDLGNTETAIAESKRLAALGIRIITLGLGASSAAALSKISTEAEHTESASSVTLSEDIRGLARGLVRKRK